MTRVVHVRRGAFDVYVGRACREFPASKWGNPYRVGVHGDKQTVIARFRQYVMSGHLKADLPELKGKVLGCWCAPEACHADVLAELANGPEPKQNVLEL